MNCPICAHELIQDSTACAEIYDVCHQWRWLECTKCGYQTESVEWIEGQPPVWQQLENNISR